MFWLTCQSNIDCDAEYIGKTTQTLGTKLNEQYQTAGHWSAVLEQVKSTGHSINWTSVKIIGQEEHLLSCKISWT